MKNYFLLFTVCLTLTMACGSKKDQPPVRADSLATLQPNHVTAIGRIEPLEELTTLSTEVNGIVQKIHAPAGSEVKANDLILELKHDVEKAELQLAEAKLRTQQQEIVATQAAIGSAQVQMKNEKTTYERIRNIYDQGAETGQNLDNARTAYEARQKEIVRLEAATGSARSKLGELESDIQVKRAQLDQYLIRAPSDGTVLTMDVRPGSLLSPGTAIGDFAPAGPITALCEVDELFAQQVQTGMSADIRQQGTTRVLAKGKVIYAGPSLRKKSLFADEAGNLEDRRVREVRILLENGKDLLLNSRVECVIYLKNN